MKKCKFYEIKHNVSYNRDCDIKWKTPAKVIEQDSPVAFLVHGGFVLK